MRFAVRARLVVAPDRQDRKIHTKPDQNGAKTDADHAQSAEKELSGRQRNEAGEKKAKRHPDQRQPPSKPGKENRAHQHD